MTNSSNNSTYTPLLSKLTGLASQLPDNTSMLIILHIWVKNALFSWFQSGSHQAFIPFNEYFLGNEEFEVQFIKMFEAEFENISTKGDLSPYVTFIHASALTISNPNFYKECPEGFKFLLEFLERTDFSLAIPQLSRLIKDRSFIEYQDDWGDSLFPEVVRSLYRSGQSGIGAKEFFNSVAINLRRFPGITGLVLEKQLSLADSNLEIAQYIIGIREPYDIQREELAINTPQLLDKVDNKYHELVQSYISADFFSSLRGSNPSVVEALANHPLLERTMRDIKKVNITKSTNTDACVTDMRAVYKNKTDQEVLAEKILELT